MRTPHIDEMLLILHSIDESVLARLSFCHVARRQLLFGSDDHNPGSRVPLELHDRMHPVLLRGVAAEALRVHVRGLAQNPLRR